jgi:hypothetical protein
MILASVSQRGDWKLYEQFLLDWGKTRKVNVSKFVPGDHFYVGDVKFDTLAEAKAQLARDGNLFGELILRHVYRRGGD